MSRLLESRIVARLLLVCAALLMATASIAWPAPAFADGDDVNLEKVLVTAVEASSPAMTFRLDSSASYDVNPIASFGMRQRWRAYFEDLGGRALLKVTLMEFKNHRGADGVRVRDDRPNPPGFPDGSRLQVYDDGSGQVAVDALKGRINVYLLFTPAQGEQFDPSVVEEILRHVMAAQLDRIPMTSDLDSGLFDYNPEFIRTAFRAAPAIAIPLIAVWLAVSNTLRDFGTLERFTRRRPQATDTTFLDITPTVRPVRRRARRRVGLQVIAAGGLVTLLTVLLPLIDLPASTPSWVVTVRPLLGPPLGLAMAIAAYILLINRNTSGLPFKNESKLPLIVGTIGAMVVMFAAAYLFVAAIAMLLFLDSWLVRLILLAIYVPIGLKVLRYSALPLRIAQQLASFDVEQTLAVDPRQEVLLLRSFQDDSLVVRMHRTARHSPIELASAQSFDRFEELLAWSLWRIGPVVAIGQPTTEGYLQPLGAAREFYSDDDWQQGAEARMRSSSLIVFVVGRSPGLWWEVSNVRRLGLLGKCLFIFPPVDDEELRQRALVLSGALGYRDRGLPTVDRSGRRLIGLYFDDAGEPVMIGVDGRDDLAYQTMIETVSPSIVVRSTPVGATAPGQPQLFNAPGEPDGSVQSALRQFDASDAGPQPPTMLAGLRFLLSQGRSGR